MDHPKPLTPSSNIKATDELTINQENSKYKIIFEAQEIDDETKLLIKVNLLSKKEYYYFKNIYSQNDFQNLSKIFLVYENFGEIISFLKTLKIEVIEKKDFLTINFNIFLPNGQNQLIELNLKKYFLDSKNIINHLLEENQILKEDIAKNQKEIANLRENILSNKDEIILLKEENKKLWEAINTLKDLNINTHNNRKLIPTKLSIDSKILESINDIDFVLDYIRKNDNSFHFTNLNLLYRGSRDGDTNEKCHKLCDNKQNILIIIKSNSGYIFGGYTKIGYKTVTISEYKVDNNCFIFSKNLEKIYPAIENKKVISHLKIEKGLCFNATITIYDNFMHNSDSWICKGDYKRYFKDLSNNFEISGGEPHFKCLDLEVFQLE